MAQNVTDSFVTSAFSFFALSGIIFFRLKYFLEVVDKSIT